MTRSAPLHVGLLCSELFDRAAGGFGGFGFAALRISEVLGAAGSDRVRLTAILPVPTLGPPPPSDLHGVRVVSSSGHRLADARTYRALAPDVLVAIDWQPNFVVPLLALPRVPVLLWMRDPRPPEEWALIRTLRLPVDGPGTSDPSVLGELEPGDNQRAARSLRWFLNASRASGRAVEVAVPTLGLHDALSGAYGIEPRRLWQLGTPLHPAAPRAVPREGAPRHAVMLGRLDPVKRPWVFWALAAARPEWRFTVLGDARTRAWIPPDGPANLDHVGHAGALRKAAVLSSADVVVNTSIHEGLPVSACEALASGAALLGTTDASGVVARFGEVVPNRAGDGLAAVPDLAAALDRLADDAARRARIASAGPRWIASVHAPGPFLAQLAQIFDRLGVPAGAALARDLRRSAAPGPVAPLAVDDRSSVPHPGRRPDFLVIGAARAGTTFVRRSLQQHPGVFVAEAEEPRHFVTDGHLTHFSGPYDDHVVNRRVLWSADRYLADFAGVPAEIPAGEISPLYLDIAGAAERIAAALPGVRLVVVLRDPADRAHSQWRLQRHWGQEPLDFRAALDQEEERLAAGWSPIYGYRRRGRYAELLRPYYDAVGAERLLVVRFEDLVDEPAKTIRSITEFIGARGEGPEPGGSVNHVHGVPRSLFVAEHLRGGTLPRLLSRALGARGLDRIRRWNEADARLSPADRADLVAGYAADLAHLESVTGLDLTAWRTPTPSPPRTCG